MKLSAKTRYALAAVINMAITYEAQKRTTLVKLAEHLNISKIYLEQVFALLKRGGIVNSTKGAQGGYLLQNSPDLITAYDIIQAVEPALFSQNEDTVSNSAPDIEQAIQNAIFSPLDNAIKETLSQITLSSLVLEAEKNNNNYMYYL